MMLQSVELKKRVLSVLAIVALSLLAYANSFHAEFQLDDDRLIRFNYVLRDLTQWRGILQFELFRPLTTLSFALNYSFGGLNPVSYHVVNFALHVSVCLLFYALLLRGSSPLSRGRLGGGCPENSFNPPLTPPFIRGEDRSILPGGTVTPEIRGENPDSILRYSPLVCFLSAVLFAVHPINTESVTYISSRSVLLCAVFFMAAMLSFDSWLRNGRRRDAVLFFLFFLLSALSKEEGALVPFVTLIYHQMFFGKESVKRHRLFHEVLILLVLCGAIARVVTEFSFLRSSSSVFLSYLSSEIYVWLRYLWLMIYPVHLNVDHDVAPLSAGSILFWASLAAVVLLVFGLWKSREKHPVMCFWGLWFFLNLLPSSVFPLEDLMAEHRVYLSALGFCACLGYLPVMLRRGKAPFSRVVAFALAGLLVFYTTGTLIRNAVWANRLTLWGDAVKKSPGKFRPNVNVAHAYLLAGAYDEAIDYYSTAITIRPDSPFAYTGLGFCFLYQGHVMEADRHFRHALQLDPGFIDAKTGMGISLYRQMKYEEALVFLQKVRPYRRDSADLVALTAISLLKTGKTEPAIQLLQESQNLDPAFSEALAQARAGNLAAAEAHLSNLTGRAPGKR